MSRAIKRLAFPCPWIIILLSLQSTVPAQSSHGWITGRVVDARSLLPIKGAVVSASVCPGVARVHTSTDSSGHYRLAWLSPGEYRLRFQKQGYYDYIKQVAVESERGSSVNVNMEGGRANEPGYVIDWSGFPNNPWATAYGTVFNRTRLENLPSSRNVWALLENQVPSTIVDRIDEGGLGTGTIPLVGLRGSSWTQSEYRLDGLNVTDPYETGKPLFYPDVGSLQEFEVLTALHASEVGVPGGSLNLTTRRGGTAYHATAEAYYLGEPFESSNLDGRLRGLGFTTTPHFRRFGEGEVALGGPAPRLRQWTFFGAFGVQHLSRILPGFAGAPTATVLSGLLRVDGDIGTRDQVEALAAGQIVNNSNLGAGAGISPSATLRGHDRFEAVQGHWTHRQSGRTALELGFGFSHASPTDTFQRGITTSPSSLHLFSGDLGGAAPMESDAARSRFSLLGHAEAFRRFPGRLLHLLDFGFDLEEALDTESLRVFGDLQMVFFPGGVPSEVIEFNTPSLTKQRLRELSLFLDDQIQVSNWLFLRVGFNLDSSRAFLPRQSSAAGQFAPARQFGGSAGVVSWTSLSPRVGLAIPVLRRFGDTRVLASFARYYHALPASYAGFANPNSIGGRVFTWLDKDGDGLFQTGEEGGLLRVFGGPASSVDPKLARPYTDEWSLGVERVFARRLEANLKLFSRKTRRRVETVNVGIPLSAYTAVKIIDPGNDGILGTLDDQVLTVFNQDPRTLGQDRYSLTNPPGLDALYRGLEAVIRAGLFKDWGLSVSFAAFKAIGATSPGNSQLQNDQGVIGTLFDDPNTLLNARGRLFFDRAFVGEIAAYGRAPLGFHLGSVIKYYDGLPFGRELIVTGLNQGPIFVMATPRGEPGGFRTQFNLTFDQRISRQFQIGNHTIRATVDAFNLLNLNKNLIESPLTGPLFEHRIPLLVENPRVIRFGIRWAM